MGEDRNHSLLDLRDVSFNGLHSFLGTPLGSILYQEHSMACWNHRTPGVGRLYVRPLYCWHRKKGREKGKKGKSSLLENLHQEEYLKRLQFHRTPIKTTSSSKKNVRPSLKSLKFTAGPFPILPDKHFLPGRFHGI